MTRAVNMSVHQNTTLWGEGVSGALHIRSMDILSELLLCVADGCLLNDIIFIIACSSIQHACEQCKTTNKREEGGIRKVEWKNYIKRRMMGGGGITYATERTASHAQSFQLEPPLTNLPT